MLIIDQIISNIGYNGVKLCKSIFLMKKHIFFKKEGITDKTRLKGFSPRSRECLLENLNYFLIKV